MKQIYDFEQNRPPVVTEKLLRKKMKKRRLQWQAALIALAAVLMLTVVVLLGYSALDWYPGIAKACLGYVGISILGCGIIAVAYSGKGGGKNVNCMGN